MEPTKKTNSFLEVIILEPESDFIHTAMGITDERRNELGDFVHADILGELKNGQKTTITEDLHKISINSKHANELVWMVFQYATNLGYNKAMNEQANNAGSEDSVSDFLRFLLEQGKKQKDSDEKSDDNSDSE